MYQYKISMYQDKIKAFININQSNNHNKSNQYKINKATNIKLAKQSIQNQQSNQYKMNDSSPHSKSASKPRRGLSLSLEKKKIKLHHYPQQQSFIFNESLFQKPNQPLGHSSKKNRIKFVEGYHKDQSISQQKSIKFFKNTDKDIKLGGTKKSLGFQKKQILIPQKIFFNNKQFNTQQKPNEMNTFSMYSDRKVLRQSKTNNLASSINYFQNSNTQKEKAFSFSLSNFHNKFIEQNQIKSTLIKQSSIPQFHETQKIELNQQLNQQSQGQLVRDNKTQRTSENQKQSIDRSTIQKLKKVQTEIDQLLARVTQTRVYLQS